MRFIADTLRGLYELLYPRMCLCCLEEKSAGKNTVFCLKCHNSFPFTDHFSNADNRLMHHFYGRVKVEKAAAMMYFREGNSVQQMLHNLKYRGMVEIGNDLGEMAADRMVESYFSRGITAIMPVPMHSIKKQQRGYNQSEVIANRISEKLQLPLLHQMLKKHKTTTTQTHKGRQERLDNISGSFECSGVGDLAAHHILLVDDVATTGATLEACIQAIQKVSSPKISVFTIAIAE